MITIIIMIIMIIIIIIIIIIIMMIIIIVIIIMACRSAEWVTFLLTAIMETVAMGRVRNPACTATCPWEGALYK